MKYILSLLIVTLVFSCTNEQLSKEEIQEYTLIGKEIAQATVKNLGGNLMKQIKAGGVKQAIPFCNVSAYPLTDELSKKYNVTIKRTSHKLRNGNNKPNEAEEKILEQYLTAISKGEKLKPIVTKNSAGKIHFYAPMKVQGKCLACHGTVSKQTDSIIKSLYPNDKATGFKEGDFRGVMSITFNN